MAVETLIAQIIHEAPSYPMERCPWSPSVVSVDSYETRPDPPLMMSAGLHNGRIERHMEQIQPIASSLIPTVQIVSRRSWMGLSARQDSGVGVA